jgi:hypothetical protein
MISKVRRPGCAAHIMMEERIPKKARNGKFHNTRSVGKQRARCKDVVHKDTLQILGIQGWRRQAGDREKWMQF